MTALTSQYENRREDLDDVIKKVADRSTPFSSKFMNLKAAADAYKFEWSDKVLNGFSDTLAASITSTLQTIITVSGGTNTPKAYKDGISLLLIDGFGVAEVALVSSTITMTTTYRKMVIARGERSSTPTTLANAGVIKIMSNPRVEGFDADRDDSQKGARLYNFTQIFERQLKISRTSQKVKVAGKEASMAVQVAEQMPELFKELECAFINNTVRSETGDVRISGGLRWAVSTSGLGAAANSVDRTSAGAINRALLEEYIATILGNGVNAKNLFLAVSHTQQRAINLLKEDNILMSQSEKGLNRMVNKYDYGTDASIEIFYSNDLAADEMYLGNSDNIEIVPLAGSKLFRRPLAVTGDNDREMLVGEYGFKFRNVKQSLFRFYNLPTS